MLDHRKWIVRENFHRLWRNHYHRIHYELFSIWKQNNRFSLEELTGQGKNTPYLRCLGKVERFFELLEVTGVGGLRSGTSWNEIETRNEMSSLLSFFLLPCFFLDCLICNTSGASIVDSFFLFLSLFIDVCVCLCERERKERQKGLFHSSALTR